MLYFLIFYGILRILMVVRKLIADNITDWECLVGGFWAMTAAVSAMTVMNG
jgi:hypothetical protein